MNFLEDGSILIDNSTLNRALCPREFQLSSILRKTLKGHKAALDAGSGIHDALDLHYRGETDPDILYGAVRNRLRRYPGEWRTPDLYCQALDLYLATYHNKDFVPYVRDGVPFIELPFALPLGEIEVPSTFVFDGREYPGGSTIPIVYAGRIDLLTVDGKSLWVVDHKTSSMTGPSYWEDFIIGQQPIGYVWAAKQNYPDLNIVGAKMNAIIVREPPKTDRSKAKTFEFHREQYKYAQEQIDEWANDVLHLCSQLILHASQNYWPKRTHCCVKARAYGSCEFINVCRAEHENREDVLSVMYDDNTWSPLDEV